MSIEKKKPNFCPATVKWMDDNYPLKNLDPGESERKIWMRVGERKLIDKMLLEVKKQNQNVLTS